MFKTRFISMLVLLMTAATGAWAQDTYKIDAVYTINGQSGGQDFSIDDASLPFTKKLSELDPNISSWKESNLDAANITVSGDNIVKGTDANWDTEITFNGAGTATVSYVVQLTGVMEIGSVTITFTVTKNEAPAASTYTVTLKEGTDDADNWTITPAEATTTGVAAGTEVKATYSGAKKVKSVKAKKKAAASLIVNPAVGQVIGDDGKNYANAAAATSAGATAVAMIAYVGSETGDDTYKNGLAIALADEAQSNWSTAKSTCEGKTAIAGVKWCLPSQDQWKQMFKANGGNDAIYTGLNTTITTAGGTTLQGDAAYWSSSESSPGVNAYFVYLDSGSADWYSGNEGAGNRVRACLAF